jgi:hypothetical protein
MIKVKNEVKSYDDNLDAHPEPLVVENHWNSDSMVVLYIGYQKVTVSARDLEAAIKNATNTVRF